MSTTDVDDLRAELAALRAENEALRVQGAVPPDEIAVPGRSHGGWWRALISAICIVVAGILVPVSIVAAWARTELVSEESFVQTFAPLADDPGVQALIVDEATTAINDAIDIGKLTDDLFDGIESLDLPPAASSALDLLREPATAGVQNLIDTSVTRIVASDAFAEVWQRALIASHRALVATAAGGGENGAVTIDASGAVGIQLGPIIDDLKAQLVDRGIGIASAIPSIDRTIVIVQSDGLALVGTVYNLAVTVGYWLPFIALGLFAIGILVARRKSTAVLGTGLAMAIGAAALAIALAAASTVLGLSAGNLGIPARTLDTVYFAVVGAMRDTAVVVTFLGVVIALAGWLSGRSVHAGRARALSASLSSGARSSLQQRGLNTGRFGAWLFAQRVLVRVLILVLAIVLLFALRPLSVGDVVLTVVLSLAVWLVIALLERAPGGDVDPLDAASADAATVDAATPEVYGSESPRKTPIFGP